MSNHFARLNNCDAPHRASDSSKVEVKQRFAQRPQPASGSKLFQVKHRDLCSSIKTVRTKGEADPPYQSPFASAPVETREHRGCEVCLQGALGRETSDAGVVT